MELHLVVSSRLILTLKVNIDCVFNWTKQLRGQRINDLPKGHISRCHNTGECRAVGTQCSRGVRHGVGPVPEEPNRRLGLIDNLERDVYISIMGQVRRIGPSQAVIKPAKRDHGCRLRGPGVEEGPREWFQVRIIEVS